VTVGTEVVYAFVTKDSRGTRLRVSADECDRLDLFAGNQLPMRMDDGEPVRALVVAVTREPPFAWVVVEFSTPTRGR